MSDAPARTRVALDIMSGDHPPDAVVDGALRVADAHPDIEVVLVGAQSATTDALAARSATGRLVVVPAEHVVRAGDDAARAVRATRDASVRVAARLVRDGDADAAVSVGGADAVVAAASFALGRLPGATRPALATVVPAAGGPLVLLDTSGNGAGGPDVWAQFALAGAALASAALGVASPRVGLLAPADDPGLGAAMRAWAHGQPAEHPIQFVGHVDAADVVRGGTAEVVVTDGFTGQVLLDAADAAAPTPSPRSSVLLGVDGVVVGVRAATDPDAVAAAVLLAARCAGAGLVARLRESLTGLVAARRERAGLGAAP